MNTITIFGGTGFVGRHLVQHLAKLGFTLKIVTRSPSNALFLKPLADIGQIQFIPANICDLNSIKSTITGSDIVINLTGILFEKGSQKFDLIHHLAPAAMAYFSKEAGVKKFIHLSAVSASTTSRSQYAQSKALGERAVLSHFPNTIILRPNLIFGPEDKFFNRFASLAGLSPVLPLFGGGQTLFQPVYVEDVVKAIIAVITKKTTDSLYELGGAQIYNFKQLMQLLLSVIGKKRLLLPLPFVTAYAVAIASKLLSEPLLTKDQIFLLKEDCVIAKDSSGFAQLGINPSSVEAILPSYLSRF